MIYLDNGATSWPKPESVYQTMDAFLREKGEIRGVAATAWRLLPKKRLKRQECLCALHQCAGDEKSYIYSQLHGCPEYGIKGLAQTGDHVISSSIGHNSLIRPLKKLERQGIKTTYLHQAVGSGCISAKEIEESITGSTKLVLVTHASNVTGLFNRSRNTALSPGSMV